MVIVPPIPAEADIAMEEAVVVFSTTAKSESAMVLLLAETAKKEAAVPPIPVEAEPAMEEEAVVSPRPAEEVVAPPIPAEADAAMEEAAEVFKKGNVNHDFICEERK